MTSETKHTPGPWEVTDNTDDGYGQLAVDSMRGAVAICYTAERGIRGAPSECIANARLIAAAPDLLAALRAAEEWAEHIEDDENRVPIDVRLAMRAAIARATGEG